MDLQGGETLGRSHTYPLENYKKGAQVWHRHPELVWISGELEHDVTFKTRIIRIRLEDDEVVEVPISSPNQLPFLRNPAILIGKDDLTALSYLHEPAVLHNLQVRFIERQCIYTYCGIVLVAINPYADCHQLYGPEVIQVYRGVGKQVRELDPHIYAVAEEAFYDLAEFNKCQSIIVSGESGAGKTVSAKFVMKYFAAIAGHRIGSTGVEDRVLATNPIMEAIGNAKTIRNDNSSRFGKFIQINFGEKFMISGAEMKTYLLEKSRLVFQAPNERNYHIFYQMCAARDHPLIKDFSLGASESYWYTAQGGDSKIPGVDDREDFIETVKALDVLGFTQERQRDVLRILKGILLLGNLEFHPNGENSYISPMNNSEIYQLCNDYKISEDELRLWLTVREIRAAGEVVRKGLEPREAMRSRDALAKLLYAQVFSWFVDRFNDALTEKEKRINRNKKFIGVLDIYGFETFDVNSFEQFCINYANEKLQQQFNQHVFKLEQEEYEREELSWVRIDFHDNQPTIELIEGRPGLIDYLDEQSKVVNGSDAAWLNRITTCTTLKKNSQLQMPRIRSTKFIVKHFAAEVPYTIEGFLEKNKDAVSKQLLELVAKTKFPLLREILGSSVVIEDTPGRNTGKKTVAGQFRDSLRDLMAVLCTTRPHYVRCIKPNDAKESFYFEPKRAIQQLRACGVLETVRISAAGFPTRWTYEEFGRRYRVLYPEGKAMWRDKPRQFAEKACYKCLEEGKFALGKTKIFFRTGQVALLERVRLETLSVSAMLIQSCWRGFVARRRYQTMRRSLLTIQAATRAFLAVRRLFYLQMHRAAIVIQTAYRRYVCESRYRNLRCAVVAIQAQYRAAKVRAFVEKMRYEKSAIVIQKYWRGYLVRRSEIERRRKIILVQCCVRRWLAKRRLRELKIESRSVLHLQKLNTGLENKIIDLQLKLDAVTSERNRLASSELQLEKLRAEVALLEVEKRDWKVTAQKAEELALEVERLETECDVKEAQKGELETRVNEITCRLDQLRAETSTKITDLTEQLTTSTANATAYVKDLKKTQSALASESERRAVAEHEMGLMREQLLQNASLLASPHFSRAGSMRSENGRQPFSLSGPDGNSVSFGGSSSDLDEIALILRQQQMINDLRMRAEQYQRENERLRNVVEASSLVDSLEKRTSLRSFESHKLQELESAYSKMKLEFERLVAEKADAGLENMNVKLLFDRLIEDNDRRREESAELRAMLSTRFERQSLLAGGSPRPDSGHWSAGHSDDGSSDLDEELCLERQCRQLKALAENLNRVLIDRNREIEKLEKRLSETTPAFRPSECSMEDAVRDVHGRLNSLASENLSLNEKLSRQSEELTEARAQLRGYTGGLGLSLDNTADSEVIRLEALSKEGVEHSALLEVFNVPEFTRILICDLKPRLARLLTKAFPAYVILAAFRYYDHAHDETALTGLFSTLHIMLKDTVTRSHDMDVLSLWLVNTWRLFNLLRQYSGEKAEPEWTAANTEKQNSHRLQSFDISPIRDQLRLRVEECYQNLMKRAVEPILSPKIVPGILQHETTSDVGVPSGARQQSREMSREAAKKGLDDLLNFLNYVHAKLTVYGADQVLLGQVFGQISSWICALSLNHLMFRKELCNFEKAIQIKHNVTEIQSWLFSKGLGAYREALEPLVQACHLLQSRKDESNIDTLCGEMTSKLKPRQVVAILQHYAPSDNFEERDIDAELLVMIQRRLNERAAANGETAEDQNTLIVMGTYLQPFNSQPFVHSDFPLETLSLPTCLHLQQVCRLL